MNSAIDKYIFTTVSIGAFFGGMFITRVPYYASRENWYFFSSVDYILDTAAGAFVGGILAPFFPVVAPGLIYKHLKKPRNE